jgi:endogenous inhibitor of DNA gyrase (YacG/DUF329 family)
MSRSTWRCAPSDTGFGNRTRSTIATHVNCPTCGAAVAWVESNRFRPFCSERCRTLDLGAWAAERHRIAGDPTDAAPDAGPEPGSGSDRQ